MNLYENIRALAKEKNISLKQLEIKAKLGNGTIGKWRKGHKPYVDTLEKVADALGVSATKLMK